MKNILDNKKLILFDGVCNLCNSSVLFVIKRDKMDDFMFAPLQGETGQQIINEYNIDTTQTDSIILYDKEKVKIYSKSTAALKVAKHLGFPFNFSVILQVIPAFIRDWVYDYVAKNRYKWYGKKDACMIPTPELKAKFLD